MANLGRHLFEAAIAHESRATGESGDIDPSTVSHRHAQAHLRKLRKIRFPGVQNGRQE
jgi:hypothetical protein